MSITSLILVTVLGILLAVSSLPSDNSQVGGLTKMINKNIKIFITIIVIVYVAIALLTASDKKTEDVKQVSRDAQNELFRALNIKLGKQLEDITIENESKIPRMVVGSSNLRWEAVNDSIRVFNLNMYNSGNRPATDIDNGLLLLFVDSMGIIYEHVLADFPANKNPLPGMSNLDFKLDVRTQGIKKPIVENADFVVVLIHSNFKDSYNPNGDFIEYKAQYIWRKDMKEFRGYGGQRLNYLNYYINENIETPRKYLVK
jgi:hypothetical protein